MSNQKAFSREIVVMPCLCGHLFDWHHAFPSPDSRGSVFIGACLTTDCRCMEFRVRPPKSARDIGVRP